MRSVFRHPAPHRRCRSTGFSLVELSVVVVIISIVAVAGLEGMAIYMDKTAYDTTKEKLAVIDKALVDYRRVNRRLPCPAYQTLGPTDTCYGKSFDGSAGQKTCNDNAGICMNLPSGEMANGVIDVAATTNDLVYGDVPVRDLGLPLSYMVDGYGAKFRYVTAQQQTSATSYDASTDAIQIRSGKLDTNCGSTGNRCQNRGNAAYAVISAGKNQRGAHLPTGTIADRNCSPESLAYDGNIDLVNCRANNSLSLRYGSTDSVAGTAVTIPLNVLYDTRYNVGTIEDNYFDDVIVWRSKNSL